MEQENETFQYTYSAKRQEEINAIRKKYLPKSDEDAKMQRLRKLDASVDTAGTIAGLIVGFIGVAAFATGMILSLQYEGVRFIVGVAAGLIGIAVMTVAPLAYRVAVSRKRDQIAPEVLKLTEELSREI